MARQRKGRGNAPRALDVPDLEVAKSAVSPAVGRALDASVAALTVAGVRFAVAGGIAVGAYGVPYATKDVDFLVGDEAFLVAGGGIVTFRPGIPIAVGTVPVDLISQEAGEEFLEVVLDAPTRDASAGVPVVPLVVLVYMKLKANRSKDKAAIVELLKAGMAPMPIISFLQTYAPRILPRFAECVTAATREGR